jgi:hypothetical protein
MANTQAMCTSFKAEILTGTHNFGVAPTRGSTAADTFKAALYLASATVNATTTAYSVTNEVTGTNYTAGGVTVTNATVPTTSGTTAYWTPSASITYTNVTLSTAFDAVLIYNSTQSNKAVSVHTFGSQTVTAGTFSLTMPANAPSTALLNIA